MSYAIVDDWSVVGVLLMRVTVAVMVRRLERWTPRSAQRERLLGKLQTRYTSRGGHLQVDTCRNRAQQLFETPWSTTVGAATGWSIYAFQCYKGQHNSG
jgi:hypothetical protein